MIGRVFGFIAGNKTWVIILAAACASVYGAGYHQGATGELRKQNTQQMAEMAAAASLLQTFHAEWSEIIKDAATATTELNHEIESIDRPIDSTCDLGPDWLRAHREAVRAANRARAQAAGDTAAD